MKKLLIITLILCAYPVLAAPFDYKYGKCKYVFHKHSESSYQHAYCSLHNGIEEYELSDYTRIDCLIPNQSVCELDFSNKIYEMIGQLAWYSLQTGLKGKGIIILDKKYEKEQMVYVERAKKIGEALGFEIEYITDDILNLDKDGKCPHDDCKCKR